jgi:lipopolysaccharide transport system ATP-binding protein
MLSDSVAISVKALGKCYRIHKSPFEKMVCLLTGARYKKGKEAWAVKDVSFEVKKGESVGLIGVNGSGKSTLLQILAGTLTPTNGRVTVNGKVAAILELGAGFNTELTGRENVHILSKIYGIRNDQSQEIIQQIIDFSEIKDYIDQPVKHYSSGMFVRLAFSMIIHVDAEILIIDEALAVGDAFFAQKCMRYLEKFRRTGTLLFVSHDMAAIRSICSRVLWLENGQVRAEGDPLEVGDLYLESRYFVSPSNQKTISRADFSDQLTPEKSRFLLEMTSSQISQIESLFSRINVVEQFKPRNSHLGAGGARIINVTFLDQEKNEIRDFSTGAEVAIKIDALLSEDVNSIIIGYFVRNRMGLNIFGDNSYMYFHDKETKGLKSQNWFAEFSFVMPHLPRGEYTVSAAIATGTNVDHTPLDWIHDALYLTSTDTRVHADVLALPPTRVRLGEVACA